MPIFLVGNVGMELKRSEAESEYNDAIAQARRTGEYELAEALYEEKLRVQDALTEQEIRRLRNELEQYQLRQTGQMAKPAGQAGPQQLSVGQIGKEYDAAIAQAQQNGEYELADTLYEEKIRAQEAARVEDAPVMRKSVTHKDDERRGLPICIATVDFSDDKAVMRQLEQAEKESVNLDYEINVSVTADGKVWRVSGESSTVKLDRISSDIQGSYAYHNHPKDKTWYSFSADDAAFFISHGEAYSKASDDLYEYVMRRRKDTLAGEFDAVYNRFKEIYDTATWEMLWDGRITDADKERYHEAMKILSKEYRFDYSRREKNDRQ